MQKAGMMQNDVDKGGNDMVVIGLTGGSGSGKSTIASLMEQRGIYVIDADKVGRFVVEKGRPALKEIVEEFGEDVLFENGELDRKKLASIVFTDREQLLKLNRITHKYITEIVKEELAANKGMICAIDAAVLKESGIIDMCDHVIAVIADKDVRVKRIMARDGISEKAANDRINSQEPDAKYVQYADFVINNSGDVALEVLLDDILSEIGGEFISER